MGVSAAYKLGKVQIGSTVIPAIQSDTVDFGAQEIASGGSGAQHNTLVAMMNIEGSKSISTMDLKNALDELTVLGKKLNPDTLSLFFFEKALGGTVKAGSEHLEIKSDNGMVLPRTLSVSQGAEATLSMEGIPISDGTNDPILIADQVPMPAGGATNPDKWTLGPAAWDRLTGINFELIDLNIQFGLRDERLGADGSPYPTFISILKEEPVITFTTLDLKQLATIPQQGLEIVDPFRFYFRKLKQGGTRHTDVETVHIEFTINSGMIIPDSLTGDDSSNIGFRIVPNDDGVNPFFAVDTTAAITAAS